MTINAGDKLGPYEIVAAIGAGGMGEVYRAHDPRVGRDVAVKVSTEQFGERFAREIRSVASLNHPNICTLYDVGPDYLVMELIEGPTLADRIKQGAIPIEESLEIARQIADALEAAHEKGIVHRDLKPANIKVKPDGAVKVLDFGLAKVGGTPAVSSDNSPTLSVAQTAAGVIFGTAAYMSPEQAKGKTVDKRADIWAFGVVLYEMLTGKQLFAGETVSDTLASVLKEEPDWEKVPAKAQRLLRACLQKDPKKRLADISDAKLLLEDAPKSAPASKPFWRQPLLWLLALIAAGSLAYVLWTRPVSVPRTVMRLAIPLPPDEELTDCPAISPDGQTIAYVAQKGADESQVYLRNLNSYESRVVAGSRGSRQPFFSTDGKWIAFFAQGQLLKSEVAGGSPSRIADAASPVGGTWNQDDSIIYTTSLNSGLLRVPASGGTPESLTKPDGAGQGYAHVWPQSLPGGRNVLFSIWGQGVGYALLSLDSRRWYRVETDVLGGVLVLSDERIGHLLSNDRNSGIKSAPFDLSHTQLTNPDVTVLADVYENEAMAKGWFAISNTGTIVYAHGNIAKCSLVWVDRNGEAEQLDTEQAKYTRLALSPDGSLAVVNRGSELWIYDLHRPGTRIRLTPTVLGGEDNKYPIWSPDGNRVYFASNKAGDWEIYTQPADGSQAAEALIKRPNDQFPFSFAPDGTLLFRETLPTSGKDLWSISQDGKLKQVRVTKYNEDNAVFSPDGRWIAYDSDESGQTQIYIQSYPGGEKRIPISTGGGKLPRWSRDGKELFYFAGDALMAMALGPDGTLASAPHRLFDRSGFLSNSHDVSLDGRHFLMIRRDPGSVPRQLNVIVNWTDELDRLAPIGKR
jgi:Tol biopolymer transport system component/predicted Ser/Thr protein kinase